MIIEEEDLLRYLELFKNDQQARAEHKVHQNKFGRLYKIDSRLLITLEDDTAIYIMVDKNYTGISSYIVAKETYFNQTDTKNAVVVGANKRFTPLYKRLAFEETVCNYLASQYDYVIYDPNMLHNVEMPRTVHSSNIANMYWSSIQHRLSCGNATNTEPHTLVSVIVTDISTINFMPRRHIDRSAEGLNLFFVTKEKIN